MTTSYDMPLPGDEYDGRTVIASTYSGPDDATALVILLNGEPPFYSVAEVDLHTLHNNVERTHPNIVPAVRDYEQSRGDY